MKSDLKERAIRLRKQGHSYSEICKELGVAQGSCSLWLKNIVLDKKAQYRIQQLQKLGQLRSKQAVQKRIKDRNQKIQTEVNKIFSDLVIHEDTAKLLCAVLYWAEGEKGTNAVAFSNSDPRMVKVFLTLLRNHFQINTRKLRALLHLHEYHNAAQQKIYWSQVTGIPTNRISIYRKPNSGRNIRIGYRGCISVRYYDVVLARKIEFIYNALIEKYGGVG